VIVAGDCSCRECSRGWPGASVEMVRSPGEEAKQAAVTSKGKGGGKAIEGLEVAAVSLPENGHSNARGLLIVAA